MIETSWMSLLDQRVLIAAAQAGLPEQQAPRATFNGEELVWAWREFKFNGAIAADVRLSLVSDELAQQSQITRVPPEAREHVQAFVSGLAWPVAPQLRYLSRLVFSASRDAYLMDSAEEERLWAWLADRLQLAWARAQEAANEVFAVAEAHQANLNDEGASR